MADLLRPSPPDPSRRRVGDWAADLLESIRHRRGALSWARAATAAGTVLVVVAAGWWLLRAPAPPIEASLPRAGAADSLPSVSSPPGGSNRSAGSAGVAGSSASSASAPADSSGSGEPARPTDTVVVQIAGAVVAPGVYRMANGDRVADLVARAGGPTADADPQAINLAARLADGQRVRVPKVGDPAVESPDSPSAPGGSGAVSAPIDLNAATVDELDALPGVGPATARAIVAHRDRSGPFRSVEGLLDVPGIGPAKLESLRDLVQV